MSQVSQLTRAFALWKPANPLREWRSKELGGMTQSMVASLIGKSAQAVRDYEAGNYSPDRKSIESMAKLLGLNSRTVKKEWERWEAKRPTI